MRKFIILIFVVGCMVLGALGRANTDPAPGRSPGPPAGMVNINENTHHVVEDEPSSSILLTKDEELTSYFDSSNDVINNNEEIIDERPTLKTILDKNDNKLKMVDDKDKKRNRCAYNLNDYLKSTDKIVKRTESDGENIDELHIDVTHDAFDTRNGLIPGIIYKGKSIDENGKPKK